ncbi:hypothetical protein VTN77DRAFT_151 [Rasamsonia byssochlamydoides]|uniref:uncharacterized protein n=1 Tax=Rasamsonia byssochlamydoides TaxID=89139 RepID=UPI0037448E52
MAVSSAAEEMERLQLSDEDTEELWNSPSQRRTKTADQKTGKETNAPRNGETLFEREEAREAALRHELQTVKNINQVIEGVLESLARAKGNMETVSRTVNSASTLLNTWTRILSQTEHNQRLILNPKWQGATHDIAEMESEAAARQQAAERRELELQQRREAALRKAEEEERKRAEAAAAAASRGTRGTSRGRVRGVLGRTPSVSYSSKGLTSAGRGTASASTTATRRPVSGIAKVSSSARGRGRT